MSEPLSDPTAPARPRGSARQAWSERLARFAGFDTRTVAS